MVRHFVFECIRQFGNLLQFGQVLAGAGIGCRNQEKFGIRVVAIGVATVGFCFRVFECLFVFFRFEIKLEKAGCVEIHHHIDNVRAVVFAQLFKERPDIVRKTVQREEGIGWGLHGIRKDSHQEERHIHGAAVFRRAFAIHLDGKFPSDFIFGVVFDTNATACHNRNFIGMVVFVERVVFLQDAPALQFQEKAVVLLQDCLRAQGILILASVFGVVSQ